MNATKVTFSVRLPQWAADFLDAVSEENCTSRNAEIVRSIAERMQAATGRVSQAISPAAALNQAALAGGEIINP